MFFVLVMAISIFSVLLASGSAIHGKCNTSFNRKIEYLLPFHAYGCWLLESELEKQESE
jgi:hypothetical protein